MRELPAVADAVPTAGGFAVGRAVWMAVRLAYRAYLRRVVYLMAVVAALPSAFGVSSRWPLVTGRPQWQLLVFGGCPPFPWGNMPLPTVIVAVHSPSLPLTALGFCPHGSGILARVFPPPPNSGQIVTQMYVLACVLGAGLQVTLLTQAPSILALMGAGPSTALFTKASAYLKVLA